MVGDPYGALPCAAMYYCPAGSYVPTPNRCPNNTYSGISFSSYLLSAHSCPKTQEQEVLVIAIVTMDFLEIMEHV